MPLRPRPRKIRSGLPKSAELRFLCNTWTPRHNAGPILAVWSASHRLSPGAESPGRLIIERNIAALRRDGVREFDFSVGNFAYKRRFGVKRIPPAQLSAALSFRGWPYAFTRSSPLSSKASRVSSCCERGESPETQHMFAPSPPTG